MAVNTYTGATNYVAGLDDLPNDIDGLTPEQLKTVFDKFGTEFKAWFNNTHVKELDADNLPYVYGVATTIKEAIESLVVGVMPNDSVTEAMLKTVLSTKINGMLPKAGGTMTGALLLGGAPTVDLHPATKKYVDDGLAVRPQIATGSYVGTGTYGVGNPTSIILDFTPKCILFAPVSATVDGIVYNYIATLINGGASYTMVASGDHSSIVTFSPTWGTTTFWHNAINALLQLNATGITYSYVAIGL